MTLEEAVRYRIEHLRKRRDELMATNPMPREEFSRVVAAHGVLVAAWNEAEMEPRLYP